MNTLLGKTLGILGGGQLSRMLAMKAQQLGLQVRVLSNHPLDPAAQVVGSHRLGDPQNPKEVSAFLEGLDFLTFESEFIPASLLKFAEARKSLHVFPRLDAMATLQDRLSQKKALQKAHLPTAAFLEIHNKADIIRALSFFKKGQFVLKKRMGGYDGLGTFIVRSEKDLSVFFKKFDFKENEWIAEEFVPFQRECAFSMARNASGEMVVLPLVEVRSHDNRCDIVFGPIKHPSLNKLIAHCAHFLEDLKYEGLCSFELFDTGKKLLVNETAPRVHNTGHYSLEALNIDQFTLHLKAGANQIFYEVKPQVPAFVMTNLLGTSTDTPVIPELFTGQLHWYGKTENRPGRKMGHVTYCGSSTKALIRRALAERDSLKNLGPQSFKKKAVKGTKK